MIETTHDVQMRRYSQTPEPAELPDVADVREQSEIAALLSQIEGATVTLKISEAALIQTEKTLGAPAILR